MFAEFRICDTYEKKKQPENRKGKKEDVNNSIIIDILKWFEKWTVEKKKREIQ